MIISASRRTDIPAFYADWFFNRLEKGYCTVFNPFNLNQVKYVSLKPEDVSVSGGITRVDNYSDRLAMLSENGSLMVLSPMENLNELQDIPPSILNNTDVNFYSDSQMLLQKAILSE